mmetsp:Transcript_17354/g.40468  ORF Transcript_17354/g.40468 Transcript_17354/m.40468 type:complete len:284 (-) Transcript_17354:34-885(-)
MGLRGWLLALCSSCVLAQSATEYYAEYYYFFNQHAQRNCTLEPCYNEENICGRFHQACYDVAALNLGMPPISLQVDFEFRMNQVFSRTERGSFGREACEENGAWLEISYEGRWQPEGSSKVKRGSSLVSIEIQNVWIKPLRDEVCGLTSVVGNTPSENECLETFPALRALCPCNGREWKVNEEVDIAQSCRDAEQCSLLHDAFVQQTHYLTYSANAARVCLSKASATPAGGWDAPEDDACIAKEETFTCLAGPVAAGHKAFSVMLASRALAVLAFAAVWSIRS